MNPVSKILGEEYNELLQDMKDCDECLHAKMEGIIPGVCQYHLNMQMNLYNRKNR